MAETGTITLGLRLSTEGLERVRAAAESLANAKRAVEQAASALEGLLNGGLEIFELPPSLGERIAVAKPGESVLNPPSA